jgi:hypothetical protein
MSFHFFKLMNCPAVMIVVSEASLASLMATGHTAR